MTLFLGLVVPCRQFPTRLGWVLSQAYKRTDRSYDERQVRSVLAPILLVGTWWQWQIPLSIRQQQQQQQQQTLAMMGVIVPDGGQAGMHPGSISMGGDPSGPPFMHGNTMQSQGIGMMGPPMGIGGAGGFPMGAGGPMHPHSAGPGAGDWGMMHPGMPQDGADYYSRGHHPGMGGPHMGMGGPPMGAGGVGGMMDMPRGGPPHGRNSRMRNHPPRVPCKYYMTSQCRFGASCSFLHPGVNGPPLQ